MLRCEQDVLTAPISAFSAKRPFFDKALLAYQTKVVSPTIAGCDSGTTSIPESGFGAIRESGLAFGKELLFFAKALFANEGNGFSPTIAGCDSGTLAYRSRSLVLLGRAV